MIHCTSRKRKQSTQGLPTVPVEEITAVDEDLQVCNLQLTVPLWNIPFESLVLAYMEKSSHCPFQIAFSEWLKSFIFLRFGFFLDSCFPLLFLKCVQPHSCLCILNLKDNGISNRLKKGWNALVNIFPPPTNAPFYFNWYFNLSSPVLRFKGEKRLVIQKTESRSGGCSAASTNW